jgi:hypothetical protein
MPQSHAERHGLVALTPQGTFGRSAALKSPGCLSGYWNHGGLCPSRQRIGAKAMVAARRESATQYGKVA